MIKIKPYEAYIGEGVLINIGEETEQIEFKKSTGRA